MSKEIVGPGQCALLIGVPVTGEEFTAQIGRPECDYAATFLEQLREMSPGLAHPKFAALEYERCVARPLREAIAHLEGEYGVKVFRGATLAALREAAAAFRVITLFTHARQDPFVGADFRDAAGLIACLAGSESPLSSSSQAAIQVPPHDLARALNETLRSENECYLRALHAGENLPPNPVQRTDLENAFPSYLRSGGHVEFSGGMATIDEMAEAIPADWTGVFDLTLCEASVITGSFKRRRPLPTCLGSRSIGTPVFRVRRYLMVIGLLEKLPQPYCDAFVTVVKLINESLESPSAEPPGELPTA